MAQLIVNGPEADDLLEFDLTSGKIVRLGRAPRRGFAIPWDRHISREHADIYIKDQTLVVRKLGTARNPIIFNKRDEEDFQVVSGEEFQIGKTRFKFVDVEFESDSPLEVEEASFDVNQLREFNFGNTDLQLEVLSKLPILIEKSRTDSEFAASLVQVLLRAIPSAAAAAVVNWGENVGKMPEKPIMLSWDCQSEGVDRFQPSSRLFKVALKKRKSVIHFWSADQAANAKYTFSGSMDWAFCTPISSDSCRGWCLYVSGKTDGDTGSSSRRLIVSEDDLKGDLRFTELLAQFIGAIRRVRSLEHQQAEMSQFFSPAVMETLIGDSATMMMTPKETDISVLFCDVRGFSRKAEQSRDNLIELLNRVSDALGVMTRGIMKHEGVIADFQGDAALAFWGWPAQLEDGAVSACLAALEIYTEIQSANKLSNHSLRGFQVGIGIAHGRAVAGKIGSQEQVKVGVFGPVVNLASRLEGLTKRLGVPILIDEYSSQFVCEKLVPIFARCRTLARVRPAGMDTPVTLSELMPPETDYPDFTQQMITYHELAVQAVIDGRWKEAIDLLSPRATDDTPSRFLLDQMAKHDNSPPPDWDGAFQLTRK